MKNWLLYTVVLMLFSPLAFADYHYASHSGSNTYPYTSWETAADSVYNAVAAANPGDTVYIASGNYEGTIDMDFADSLIAIIGAGMDSTLLYTHEQSPVIYIGPKTYIGAMSFSWEDPYDAIRRSSGQCDLTIEQCWFRGTGMGIHVITSNLIIRDCIFEELRGVSVNEPFTTNLSLVLSNCLFRHNFAEPVGIYSLHAVIKNNIVIDCRQYSSFSMLFTPGSYVHISNNIIMNYGNAAGFDVNVYDTSSRIENNVLNQTYNSRSGDDAAFIGLPSFDFRIVNNSFTNSGRGLALFEDNQLSVHYSNFWNNPGGNMWAAENGSFDTSLGYINVNPMFENPEVGNFRLQTYSPLIDAGDPNILDVDGTRSDIGAYGGPMGDWTIYQDLPPQIPDSLQSTILSDTILITWKMNTESDFNRYIVWRDTVSGFTPWAGNITAEPESCQIIDLEWDREHNYYYRVAAYDNQWNLSGLSSELAVINVGIWGEPLNLPYTTYIETNYPNPFNDATTISFFVADIGPRPAEITIEIYDVLGRKVLTLLNGKFSPGKYQITWDGRDDNGNPLSSGVYFARIGQWGIDFINKPRKLVILK